MMTVERPRGPLTAAVVIASLWVLLLVAVVLSPLDAQDRAAATQAGILITAMVAAGLCLGRAVRSAGRRRRAWALLAAAGATGFLGNMLAAALGGDGWSDIGLLVALLLGIAALLQFPDRPLQRPQLLRMLLDGVVVGGSVLFVSAIVVFPEALAVVSLTPDRVIALVLPVVDAVLATLAVVLILRSTGPDRVPLALVGLSFTMYAVADLSYAVLDAGGGFQFGTLVDLGWVVGYALGGVAACHPMASGRSASDVETDVEREGSPVAGTIVIFTLFAAAAAVQIRDAGSTLSPLAIVLWFVVLAAVAARQVSLVVTNERLRRGLERRVAERTADLADLNRTTQLTLTSMGEGIYGVDREGVITFVNPAAARTVGYPAEELIGAHAHDLLHGPDPDGLAYPYDRCYVAEAIASGVTTRSEDDVYRRADGMHVPVEVTASPLADDGTVRGAVVVFRDVTQRREIDRIKTEFVSVISHELRTPLTAIKGSLGLVAGGAVGEVSPAATRLLSIAATSVDRLARLINDILEVERMDSGTEPLHLSDVDVTDAVHRAVEALEPLAVEAGVTLEVLDVPGVVRGDVDRIEQTLVNLLGNAVKFTDSGGTVSVRSRRTGTFVEIAVTDTGRGIPSDKLEAIFARFEQVDSSDARERGGTGLGLAISRGIVARHGGRIWAESEPGQGSTFRFTLPSSEDIGAIRVDRGGDAPNGKRTRN